MPRQNKLYPSLAVLYLITLIMFLGCGESTQKDQSGSLPVLGNKVLVEGEEGDKKEVTPTVPAFSFYNQDSVQVTEMTFEDKIYVADFFFTTCPTICPKMSANMADLHDDLLDNDQVLLLSHTIDPDYDSVAVLKDYAEKLGVTSKKWHLVTGDKAEIYEMANHYLVNAAEDDKAPGGYIHSGAFILVDKNKQVRGLYDGTDPKVMKELLADIAKLQHEPKLPESAELPELPESTESQSVKETKETTKTKSAKGTKGGKGTKGDSN